MGIHAGEAEEEGRKDETGIMEVLPFELILYILLCVDSHQTVTATSPSPVTCPVCKVDSSSVSISLYAPSKSPDQHSSPAQLCSCASTSRIWHELCTVQPFRDLGKKALTLQTCFPDFTPCAQCLLEQMLWLSAKRVCDSHPCRSEISLELAAGEADVEKHGLLPRSDGL